VQGRCRPRRRESSPGKVHNEEVTVVSSWRYLGSLVGFGFGVVWMTAGLGSAIVALLFAGLGYGVVFVAERAQSNAGTGRRPNEPLQTDEPALDEKFELDHEHYDKLPADRPIEREAEWPLPPLGRPRAARPVEVASVSPGPGF
jgi:hypothetical protein